MKHNRAWKAFIFYSIPRHPIRASPLHIYGLYICCIAACMQYAGRYIAIPIYLVRNGGIMKCSLWYYKIFPGEENSNRNTSIYLKYFTCIVRIELLRAISWSMGININIYYYKCLCKQTHYILSYSLIFILCGNLLRLLIKLRERPMTLRVLFKKNL